MRKIPIRRSDTEKIQVGDYYDGVRKYYDHNIEHTVIKVMTGEFYVTAEVHEMLVTILGSCVAVCMYDPIAEVGGMNHILLPGNNKAKLSKGDPGFSTRYGVFAMEELINGLLKLGAHKSRIKVKMFGGGNVIKNSAMIGTKNIEFVKEFLGNEKFTVESGDVGGNYPRRVHFYPESGRVFVRTLRRRDDMKIAEVESKFKKSKKSMVDTTKFDLF